MDTILWAGLATGAVYALIAIGYNVTIIGAGVVNFAFAHLIMFSSFIAVLGFAAGWPIPVIFMATVLTGAILGGVEERVAIRPMKPGGAGELITTVGFGTVLTGLALAFWGGDPLAVPFLTNQSVSVFGSSVQIIDLLLIVCAIVIGIGLQVWMRRSKIGLAAMARSEDREAAMLRGVNVRTLSLFAFIGAGLLAGLLAPVVAAKTFAWAFIPLPLAIKGFTALTLGGLGSNVAVLVGGLVIGLIEATTRFVFGGVWGNIAVFLIYIAVLLLRPQGLLGTKELRKV